MIIKGNEPIRVLHILTGLSTGGAESFIMNMYRNMDRSKVQFDFLLRSTDNIYHEELEKMGSRVYVTASFPRHFIKNAIQTARFFKEHSYDIIHVHANALLYTYAISCAKRNGVKCRIIHSHNAAMAHMRLLPLHKANKRRITSLATDCFACSDDAGRWMFPGGFKVIPNAIDLRAFAYDIQKRKLVRQNLGIGEDDFVIGHIGRFTPQKNHAFLLDVFAEVTKRKPNAKLLLLGDGELRRDVEEKTAKLQLQNRVIFLGARKDVSDIINAFDVFVFPSIYEGLAIAMLEAQANGLRVVCSDMISDQTVLTSFVKKLSLSDDASVWAGHVLNVDSMRNDAGDALVRAGFDIRSAAKNLQEFYLSKAGQ